MAFLTAFAMTAFFGIFGLFALQKFNYGPQEVGVVLVVMGLVSAIGQGLLTGPLTERWGEAPLIKIALLASAVAFAGMALVQSTPAVLAATGFFSLAIALLTPAVTSLTSKHTNLLQGITMGLSNSFGSLGRIFGPFNGRAAPGYRCEPSIPLRRRRVTGWFRIQPLQSTASAWTSKSWRTSWHAYGSQHKTGRLANLCPASFVILQNAFAGCPLIKKFVGGSLIGFACQGAPHLHETIGKLSLVYI